MCIMQVSPLKNIKLPTQLSLNVNILIILTALYFSVVLNHPVIQKVYLLSHYDFPLYLVSHLLLICAFTIIFSLLAWPYIFKIILIPLILTSALTFYASVKYKIMFDYSMMESIFETNSGEAFSYINLSSTLYFIGLGLVPALLLFKVKITYSNSLLKTLFLRGALLCSMLFIIGLITTFFYKDYASIGRNNHYLHKMINPAHAYNTFKYINKNYLAKPMKYLKLGEDAQLMPATNNKPTLMIFFLEKRRALKILHIMDTSEIPTLTLRIWGSFHFKMFLPVGLRRQFHCLVCFQIWIAQNTINNAQ